MTLLVLIVVLGGLAILVAYFLWRWIASKAQMTTKFKTRPPAVLNAPVTITYHCDVTVGRQPTHPLKDVEVTFSISTGDASVDGGASKTVVTGLDGDASVLLVPMKTGADSLLVHLKAGSREGDETPIPFEVIKH